MITAVLHTCVMSASTHSSRIIYSKFILPFSPLCLRGTCAMIIVELLSETRRLTETTSRVRALSSDTDHHLYFLLCALLFYKLCCPRFWNSGFVYNTRLQWLQSTSRKLRMRFVTFSPRVSVKANSSSCIRTCTLMLKADAFEPHNQPLDGPNSSPES